MRGSFGAGDGMGFILVVEVISEDAGVLAPQVLGNDCNVHLLGEVLQDLTFLRASD